MKTNINIKLIICLLAFAKCNSDSKDFINASNYKDTNWITKNLFILENEKIGNEVFSDTTILKVRISSKRVMKGFVKGNNSDSLGTFSNLIQVFSDFNLVNHNPNGIKKYLFFNGDDLSDNQTDTLLNLSGNESNAIFNLENYTAIQNNLHWQFKLIADELEQENKKIFHVIISDGESSIIRFRNENRNEGVILQDALIRIFQKNPDVCIGVLSLPACFNGEYVYDPQLPQRSISCIRYLYAYCIFDKKFTREFCKFKENVIKQGGKATLFNPKISQNDIETSYTVSDAFKQTQAKTQIPYLNSFLYSNSLPDSIVIKNSIKQEYRSLGINTITVKEKQFNADTVFKLKYDSNQNEKIDTLTSKNNNQFVYTFKPKNNGFFKLEYQLQQKYSLSDFSDLNLPNQHIDDNTIFEINALQARNSVLKTEGLQNFYQAILDALKNSNQISKFNNYLTIIKK